jgi:hypothetical protein
VLTACSQDKFTLVELHHKQPSELTHIIDQQLGDDIEYKIAGQTIIFYDSGANIQSTINLLEILDKQPRVYALNFSWKNPRRASTIKLPSIVSIQQDQNNLINLFNTTWHVDIKPANQTQVWLSLKTKERRKVKSEQHYLLTLNQPGEVANPLLPEDLMINVMLY